MEKLNKLTEALNEVERCSTKIIKKAIPIMESLESQNSELVYEIIDECPHLDKKSALKILQDACLELIKDAETIIVEISSFTDAIIIGENTLMDGEYEYPFLMQVWYGDIYGTTKIESLKTLSKDLKIQCEKICEDVIIDVALAKCKLMVY